MCCSVLSLYDCILGAVCVAECQVMVYLVLHVLQSVKSIRWYTWCCVCCRVLSLYDGILGAACVAEC